MRRTTPIAERFWPKVDKRGPDECWEWQAYVLPNGYGLIGRGRAGEGMEYAHRQSYLLAHGDIPPGLFVCHRCDNRRCVNPSHLFLGTIADNNADAAAKGRSALGERNGMAKLTDAQVREIRSLKAAGIPQADLARNYGVGPMQISRIVNYQNRRTA